MRVYLEPLVSSLLLLLETTSGSEEQEMLERLEMLECFLEHRICCACATMSLQPDEALIVFVFYFHVGAFGLDQ